MPFEEEQMQIKLLKHSEIDFKRWDDSISNARNTLPYAYSCYLNAVSPCWEALVSENYEFVMPLPVKKLLFFKYIAQPPFCQQLGVFSATVVSESVLNLFLKKIPYLVLTYSFNEWNFVENGRQNPNYVLNLSLPKNELYSRFSKNTQRNIQKAKKYDLSLGDVLSKDEFFAFYQKNHKKAGLLFEKHFSNFIVDQNTFVEGEFFGVRTSKNELIAAVFCLRTKNRITYLAPISNEEGKQKSAMFLLVDYLIANHSNVFLDFEGSRIDGVARFYKGFGAEQSVYYTVGYGK